jgi:hypothetical protein
MTPKEKAKELVDKFRLHVLEKDFFGDSVEHDNAKQCALIAVDELINSMAIQQCNADEYWQEVKQEIEKL